MFTLGQDNDYFEIEVLQNNAGWRVTGPRISELAVQTYWDVEQAVMRVHQILERMGVIAALRKAGVEEGDTVFLDDIELQWMW